MCEPIGKWVKKLRLKGHWYGDGRCGGRYSSRERAVFFSSLPHRSPHREEQLSLLFSTCPEPLHGQISATFLLTLMYPLTSYSLLPHLGPLSAPRISSWRWRQ